MPSKKSKRQVREKNLRGYATTSIPRASANADYYEENEELLKEKQVLRKNVRCLDAARSEEHHKWGQAFDRVNSSLVMLTALAEASDDAKLKQQLAKPAVKRRLEEVEAPYDGVPEIDTTRRSLASPSPARRRR